MSENLKQRFGYLFDVNDDLRTFFAPGRVNLIGEHIDYNGGSVFPCALDFGITAVVAKREDRLVRVFSTNFEDTPILEFNLDALKRDNTEQWAVYVKGMFSILADAGHRFDTGLNILYEGKIPNDSGLSSSAAVSVLTGYILDQIYNLNIDKIQIALYAQACENKYVGVNCGIMDQFAIAMGKESHAIQLNTNTLDYKYVPLDLAGYKLIISNSNVKRRLETSKYNERRAECQEALDIVKNTFDVETLADLSFTQLESLETQFTNETVYRRARHVVSECERSNKAVEALEAADLAKMGQLMNESHVSLRDDYEVSCPELDVLVDTALSVPGVLGSRLTGAGFGGCTVSIVKDSAIDEFEAKLTQKYHEVFNKEVAFYVANAGEGVQEL